MAENIAVPKKRSSRFGHLSDQQKINEMEALMYQIEAVAGAIQPLVDGTEGGPSAIAHGLQETIMTLADRGLEITGAR